MNATLEYATTPLALASLLAILMVGILKLVVKGKNNALNRLVTHYGFAMVLAFGVLGNLAYLYESYQSSEAIIIGTVVDKDGNYLPRVIIDTGGHARGMTSDSGDFVLAIPKSRVQREYSISAALDGYERDIKVVNNSSRMFVRFELEKKLFDAGLSIQVGDNRVVVGHYLGLPEVIMQVRFTNETMDQLHFRNIGMELVSPDGELRRLIPVSTSVEFNGPALPALPNVLLEPGQTLEYYYRFVQFDGATQQLANRVQSSLQSNPLFQSTGPRIGAAYLDSSLAQEIATNMESRWFWKEGNSTLRLSANVRGQPVILARGVAIMQTRVQEMKNIQGYYADGFGIFHNLSLMPVGRAQPGIEVMSSAAL